MRFNAYVCICCQDIVVDYVTTLVQHAIEHASGKGSKPTVADLLFLIRKVRLLASWLDAVLMPMHVSSVEAAQQAMPPHSVKRQRRLL